MSILAAFALPHPPIILPEIGQGQENKIKNTIDAYNIVSEKISELAPDTIVIISPHSTIYADYFHISPGKGAEGNFEQFAAENVKINAQYDDEFVKELEELTYRENIPAGTLGETEKQLDHGTMIPLYFLNKYCQDYRIVRIGLSGLSPFFHYNLGKCIKESSEKLERRVVIIASGDLSHKLLQEGPYGFAEEGPIFDKQVCEIFEKADFLSLLSMNPDFSDAAGECGLKSFQIMAGAMDCQSINTKLFSYEGPFGVGYAVAGFVPNGNDTSRDFGKQYVDLEIKRLEKIKKSEDEYVRLARLSLESYIRQGKKIEVPKDISSELINKAAGAFVSLKKEGRLRGCIGTISPVTNSIAEEIVRNAVSAGSEDPRFDPIETWELDELEYSVDVLGEIEPIAGPKDLDVVKYGVIVEAGRKRGLLLPNLEGVKTVEEQIAISKQKAGINPNEKVKMYRFEVVRHK